MSAYVIPSVFDKPELIDAAKCNKYYADKLESLKLSKPKTIPQIQLNILKRNYKNALVLNEQGGLTLCFDPRSLSGMKMNDACLLFTGVSMSVQTQTVLILMQDSDDSPFFMIPKPVDSHSNGELAVVLVKRADFGSDPIEIKLKSELALTNRKAMSKLVKSISKSKSLYVGKRLDESFMNRSLWKVGNCSSLESIPKSYLVFSRQRSILNRHQFIAPVYFGRGNDGTLLSLNAFVPKCKCGDHAFKIRSTNTMIGDFGGIDSTNIHYGEYKNAKNAIPQPENIEELRERILKTRDETMHRLTSTPLHRKRSRSTDKEDESSSACKRAALAAEVKEEKKEDEPEAVASSGFSRWVGHAY